MTTNIDNRILTGDAWALADTLPDNSVNCIVTSPPYWALRDYGENGQFGLEATPEEYIAKLVDLFRRLWPKLRDDGTVFLNLGDSYFSGDRHATAYDRNDKEPVNYPNHDCLCGSLCDVCREVYRRKSHTYDLLAPMLIASLSSPNHEHREFQIDHFPTSDLIPRVNHILSAIQDHGYSFFRDGERLLSFRASMLDEFSRRLLDVCLQRDNSFSCLLCGRSLVDNVLGYVHISGDVARQSFGNLDSASLAAQQKPRNQYKDMVCEYCTARAFNTSDIQPQCTTERTIRQLSNLKPKDLVGIPWRVALALQADGWYLRSDIIWHKPNPMPESVTDRPTKAHEYIFLLTKNARYWYDNEAVKEPVTCDRIRGPALHPDLISTNGNNGLSQREIDWTGRNRRTVWTIATQPFSEAHFATFPPKLIEPCILAGCPHKVCAECGAPWVRVTAMGDVIGIGGSDKGKLATDETTTSYQRRFGSKLEHHESITLGFEPTCDCHGHFTTLYVTAPSYKREAGIYLETIRKYVPDYDMPLDDHPTHAGLVLDPFMGAGTTALVAIQHNRRWLGFELSQEYIEMANNRLNGTQRRLL